MSPLMKLLILAAVLGAGIAFLASPMFDIAAYEVEGNSYYSDDEILVMGNCKTGGNIFWEAGLSDIQERLSRDAYMQEVTVKRSLPATVKITIEERKQTAAIVYGEKFVVIDGSGTVLRKTSVEPKIPVIKGLTISKMNVGQPIETEESVLLRQTLEMLASMEKGDMYFKKIEISKVQIRAFVDDSLICQGSPEQLMEAMEAGKLQIVIQELFEQDIERGTIKVSGEDYISFTPKID
ncbi:MAG: FtsQ-type POTRA domain-containing protein [Firmicutes bacterium]|nr:FtsQ-type POTRA domain-containing protein [Bacillota bacterium]